MQEGFGRDAAVDESCAGGASDDDVWDAFTVLGFGARVGDHFLCAD